MRRPLSTHELVMRFTAKWQQTHDLEACVETLRADVLMSGEALVAAALPSRARRSRPAYQTPLTAAEMLALQDRARPVLAAVALRHGLSIDIITGSDRSRDACLARHDAQWILSVCRRWPLRDAAGAVGRTDHTASIWAVKKVEARIKARPGLREELLELAGGRAREAA